MAHKTDNFDYGKKAAELEQVLRDLQDQAIQLDAATTLHAKGLALVDELEAYLNQAENKIRKHAAE